MSKSFLLFKALLIFYVNVFGQIHPYEIVEETFIATKTYSNPYMEVDLWVTLYGPDDLTYRVPAFWDGDNTFRVRLVPTISGEWSWTTGNSTDDSGLDNKSGDFLVIDWDEAELQENANRKGFLKVNGRHLEYADGTPFFLTADTKSTLFTDLFRWDDGSSSRGISGAFFQEAVQDRKAKGFNTFQVISCFPSDLFDELWQPVTHGKKHAEDGSWPFDFLPPDSEGIEHPDFSQINPEYWQQLDRKFQYLSDQGMITNLEVLRRSEEKILDSQQNMTAFIRYLWARFGCYNMIFSWMHIDAGFSPASAEFQQLLEDFIFMLKITHEALNDIPYHQPKTIMVPWGTATDIDYAPTPNLELDTVVNSTGDKFIDINTFSNTDRKGRNIPFKRQMFERSTEFPVLNVEPYWVTPDDFFPRHEFLTQVQQAQFNMYGSVLNGGAVLGHTWGDSFFSGAVSSSFIFGENLDLYNVASVGKMKEFIQNDGHDYRMLIPAPSHLDYLQSSVSSTGQDYELHSLALTPDKDLGLGFISATLNSIDLIGLQPNTLYQLQWWHIDHGGWQNTSNIITDENGRLVMPDVPNNDRRGWAFRVTSKAILGTENLGDFDRFRIYPNPTSKATIVSYSLNRISGVQLHIMDYSGRIVQILVDEIQSAGKYTVEHNISELSEGIYFYQLKVGDQVSAKRLIKQN